jgi:hypothetical protein
MNASIPAGGTGAVSRVFPRRAANGSRPAAPARKRLFMKSKKGLFLVFFARIALKLL